MGEPRCSIEIGRISHFDVAIVARHGRDRQIAMAHHCLRRIKRRLPRPPERLQQFSAPEDLGGLCSAQPVSERRQSVSFEAKEGTGVEGGKRSSPGVSRFRT